MDVGLIIHRNYFDLVTQDVALKIELVKLLTSGPCCLFVGQWYAGTVPT